MNPWNLSEREEQVLSALAQAGTDKRAARVLGVSPRTIEFHVTAARKKMGEETRLRTVLAWDRVNRREP